MRAVSSPDIPFAAPVVRPAGSKGGAVTFFGGQNRASDASDGGLGQTRRWRLPLFLTSFMSLARTVFGSQKHASCPRLLALSDGA